MQNINEIEIGFQFTGPLGRGTETLTVFALPTKKVKSFRVTSDSRSQEMTITPFQMAKLTGLVR